MYTKKEKIYPLIFQNITQIVKKKVILLAITNGEGRKAKAEVRNNKPK